MTQEERNKKNEYMRLYRAKNKDKFKSKNKKYREGENREKYLKSKKKYYEKNKAKIQKDNKNRNEINKEKYAISKSKYYLENKEKLSKKNKEWKDKNPERNKELKKLWYEKNKHKRIESDKLRREKDSLFKLKTAISARIRNGIKSTGFSKNFKTKEILGCTYEEFKIYIESKFKSWMNWSNYGLYNGELNYGWDLDHIIPLNSSKTEQDVLKLNYYTNFQPLCSKVNRDIKWKY
jgi:hypothetical protein